MGYIRRCGDVALLAAAAVPGTKAQDRTSSSADPPDPQEPLLLLSPRRRTRTSRGRTRRPKAGLRLDGKGWILKGSKNNVVVIPGKLRQEHALHAARLLDPDDDDIMPARGKPLTKRSRPTLIKRLDRRVSAKFG